MKNEFTIRNAHAGDSAFVAEAIIAAEKSGTGKMLLGALFDLGEAEVRKLVLQMLEEEADGCEFSLNCFLMMEHQGQPVAAVAGWIESFNGAIPSGRTRANLLSAVFPANAILKAHSRQDIINGIRLEREKDTLQIEYVYTVDAYRGRGLAEQLIGQHIINAKKDFPGLRKAQVQVFGNNRPAARLYERAGFKPVQQSSADHPDAMLYLPYHEKILMEKILKA